MMPRLVSAWVALALLGTQSQRPPTFGTSTDAVSVNVAVFDGDRVITSLSADQFEVRDNGVLQTVTSADFNRLPITLRLVFDTSGSISEEDLAANLRTMRRVAGTLGADDRCEIVTFNRRVVDAAAEQHPPIRIDLARNGPDGTAFFDAVLLSLVTVPTADRRQITIVLSDAMDNASFFDEAAMMEAARRTDAVVYTVLPGDPSENRSLSVARLQALSLLTGGRLVRTIKSAVASVVLDAIEEFRKSYLVRYTLTGVPVDGWHKLDVKVKGGGYRIRAKSGYFGR